MADHPESFDSIQAEASYWKEACLKNESEMEELISNSSEIEAQLEAELKSKEDKLKKADELCAKLKSENQQLKDASRSASTEATEKISQLQSKVAELQSKIKDAMAVQTKLETENDNLERRDREASASIQSLSEKVDDLLELIAVKDTELEESKATYEEQLQRVRDEKKDLESEMAAREFKATMEVSNVQPEPVLEQQSAKAMIETVNTEVQTDDETKEQADVNIQTDALLVEEVKKEVAPAVVEVPKSSPTTVEKKLGEMPTVAIPAPVLVKQRSGLSSPTATSKSPKTPTAAGSSNTLRLVGDMIKRVKGLEQKLTQCRAACVSMMPGKQQPV